MKRLIRCLLIMVTALSVCAFSAFAAEEKPDISAFELPKPAAPNYMMYEAADRDATEGNDALYVVRRTDMSVLELSLEESQDREAFLKKYGLYDFVLVMQYDTSLDGTENWNHTSEWDTSYSAPSPYEACGIAWIGEELIDKETIFDLYAKDPDNDNYQNMAAALIHRAVDNGDYTFDNYYFDHENHSLSVRCRYYMEWETYDGETVGERQSKYGEWSDVAVFGKNGTVIVPEEPEGYEAPVIVDLAYEQPGEGAEFGSLTYHLTTPESVWEAAIYYKMTDQWGFDTLETEISVDDGDWQSYETINNWGDWALSAGVRTAYAEEPRIEADTYVKLRARYTGAHGASEWSNVIEMNGGGTQVVSTETAKETVKETVAATTADSKNQAVAETTGAVHQEETKSAACGLCGFCPTLLGLCIFIWLAIVLVIIVVVIVILKGKSSNKCKKCGAALMENDKFCPNCGTPRK